MVMDCHVHEKNEHKVPYDLIPLCKRYHSVLHASIVDRDKERVSKRERALSFEGNASHVWPTFASASKSLALSSFAPFRLLAPLLSTISCVFFFILFLLPWRARSGRIIPWEGIRRGNWECVWGAVEDSYLHTR